MNRLLHTQGPNASGAKKTAIFPVMLIHTFTHTGGVV